MAPLPMEETFCRMVTLWLIKTSFPIIIGVRINLEGSILSVMGCVVINWWLCSIGEINTPDEMEQNLPIVDI